MLVSLNWLQEYVKEPLPKPEKIAELLTMHAFELEGYEAKGNDVVFDVKVLPNRAHDCLSHEGVAREITAIAKLTFVPTPDKPPRAEATGHELSVSTEDASTCPRFTARIIEGVEVGDSPSWLKERLLSIGQRPINNVVDITNYVMFATGQPLHAFDLDKLAKDGNKINLGARKAKKGEKLVTLDEGNKEIVLDESMLIIADVSGPVGLAGIKGGKAAEIERETRNIVIEAANFEPTGIRKTRIEFGVVTDASKRFEHGIAPEMAGRGSDIAAGLILELAGGKNTKAGELKDAWANRRAPYKIGVSVSEVNKLLGTKMSESDVGGILKRLGFEYEVVEDPVTRICELAHKYLDIPYKYAASISYDAPRTFDCSSFVAYLYSQVGVSIPRITIDQFLFGSEITKEDLRPGDVIFSERQDQDEVHNFTIVADGSTIVQHVKNTETREFLPNIKIKNKLYHNGIYLGNREIAHASGKWHKNSVVIEKVSESPAFENIVGYRRFINDKKKRFVITAPYERIDLIGKRGFMISGNREDIIEEIGRLYGYENIPTIIPDKADKKPVLSKVTYYSNVIRKTLSELEYSEVRMNTIVGKGEVELENPMAEDKRFLRTSLHSGISDTFAKNSTVLPLIGLQNTSQEKIFEIGKVFTKNNEYTSCAIVTDVLNKKSRDETVSKIEERLGIKITNLIKDKSDWIVEFNLNELLEKLPEPKNYAIGLSPGTTFKPISSYPFVLRDIAVFVPKDTSSSKILDIIEKESGGLLIKNRLFDEFRKGDKVSYAFNLVFQSYDKTLSDAEVNEIMERMTTSLNKNEGWKVR